MSGPRIFDSAALAVYLDEMILGAKPDDDLKGITLAIAEWRLIITALRRGKPGRKPGPPRVKNAMQAAGGRARAASLTPERRREIAKLAAAARWNPKVVVMAGGSFYAEPAEIARLNALGVDTRNLIPLEV